MAPSLILLLLVFSLVVAPAVLANSALFSDTNDALWAGDSLTNGPFSLTLTPDCNLVLTENGPVSIAQWASHTAGLGEACHLKVNSSGFIVLYDGQDKVIWSEGRLTYSGEGRYAFVLGPDGSLGIYGPPIWSTGYQARRKAPAGDSNYILYSSNQPSYVGDTIKFDTPILENGDYSLYIRSPDCNLVINTTTTTTWETSSNYEPGSGSRCLIQLKTNGELFVGDTVQLFGPIIPHLTYRIWGTGVTSENRSYICALRASGELAIYGVVYSIYEPKASAYSTIKMVTKA